VLSGQNLFNIIQSHVKIRILAFSFHKYIPFCFQFEVPQKVSHMCIFRRTLYSNAVAVCAQWSEIHITDYGSHWSDACHAAHRHGSVCFYPPVYLRSHGFLAALFAIWRVSHAIERSVDERESPNICARFDFASRTAAYLYYEFHGFRGRTSRARARVCQHRNESDWVLVDVITQQPSLPGIFAL